MNLIENLSLAIGSLKSNKIRSILTMLGIIIGISSVIGILTVGDAVTKSVNSSLSSMGTKNIYVYVAPRSNDFSNAVSNKDLITDELIENVENYMGNSIKGISVSKSAGAGTVRVNQRVANVSLNGTTEKAATVGNIKILAGRFIQNKDIKSARNIGVVSDIFAKRLFNNNIRNAIGKEITVNTSAGAYSITIVGIYKFEENPILNKPQSAADKDKITLIHIPLSTSNAFVGNSNGHQMFITSVNENYDTNKTNESILKYMNKYYKNNPSFHIVSESVEAAAKQASNVMNTIKVAISVIAGISLLVGGIGVMNIMLVSVTERTREIGIRKALGATNFYIRMQFIIESMIVCLIGGIIGILLGTTLGLIGSVLMKSPTLPSLSSIIISVGFSIMIGVFFGFYPANKAALLDPIDALRYE